VQTAVRRHGARGVDETTAAQERARGGPNPDRKMSNSSSEVRGCEGNLKGVSNAAEVIQMRRKTQRSNKTKRNAPTKARTVGKAVCIFRFTSARAKHAKTLRD